MLGTTCINRVDQFASVAEHMKIAGDEANCTLGSG